MNDANVIWCEKSQWRSKHSKVYQAQIKNHLRTLKSQSVVVCFHEGTDKTLKLCLSFSNIDKIYVYRLEFFFSKMKHCLSTSNFFKINSRYYRLEFTA